MAATYEPISSTTLTTNTTSITFSSIPQTYTDLVLSITAFSSGTATVSGPIMRVGNNTVDSGLNYSQTNINANGSTVGAGNSGANDAMIGIVQDASTTIASIGLTTVFDYTNTTNYKTAVMQMHHPQKNTTLYVNQWRSTSAINILTCYSPDLGSASTPFTVNSIFTLYGVKQA